jgi:hypothetical protein
VLVVNLRQTINLEELASGLNVAAEGLEGFSYTTTLEEISTFLAERYARRFVEQVDPELRPWAPRKHNRDPGRRILVLTGLLEGSGQPGAAGSFIEFGGSSVEQGVDENQVPYAPDHQNGRWNMVARPVVGINADDATQAAEITANRVEEHVFGRF